MKYVRWALFALGFLAVVKLAYLGLFWLILPTAALNGLAIYLADK